MRFVRLFDPAKQTIQQRLLLIIIFVSTTTLLLAIIMVTLYQIKQTRESMVSEMKALAAVIANNTKTAIAFNDRIDAEGLLGELHVNETVDAVTLYNLNGSIFAEYFRTSEVTQPFAFPQKDDYFFKNNSLFIQHVIEDETGKLGDVYLIANIDNLNQQLMNTFRIILIIFVSSVVISYVLSLRLQRNISDPILNLANTTKKVRESNTYNERVESSGISEIDQVKEEFNALLDQISIREEDLKHLASHDVLTKLPNRAYFSDMLIQALIRGMRKYYQHGILFVDLDRFKTINDSLGHTAGDNLLEQFSTRLITIMRGEDLVARLGGDEFTILLQEVTGREHAIDVALRVINTLRKPFLVAGHEVVISPSIGIVMYPEHGATPEELLKNADTAMYAAKNKGGNQYAFFDKNMDIAAQDRLHIEQALRKGVDNDEFYLQFQPQINLKNKKINGFESLCRWSKRGETMVGPAVFIPVAEETGLIIPIGTQLLDKAFGQIKRWVNAGLLDGRVAINISPKQFTQYDPDLYGVISELLKKHDLSPHYIELEITEAALMEQSGQMIDIMKKFKREGFEFAIDDFGTGYSSLSLLRELPIDILKIDKSFTRTLDQNIQDLTIIQAVTGLGKNLSMSVIAEGVESEKQMQILFDQHCFLQQGYHFSPPVSYETLLGLMDVSNKLSPIQIRRVFDSSYHKKI